MKILHSRMLCIEQNQLIEDAATGSASTCFTGLLLKYHKPVIRPMNNQGEKLIVHHKYISMGKQDDYFDIKIVVNHSS
jgi:trans-2,3-dihydro-3-hydroxyanthranilate isomerase